MKRTNAAQLMLDVANALMALLAVEAIDHTKTKAHRDWAHSEMLDVSATIVAWHDAWAADFR